MNICWLKKSNAIGGSKNVTILSNEGLKKDSCELTAAATEGKLDPVILVSIKVSIQPINTCDIVYYTCYRSVS